MGKNTKKKGGKKRRKKRGEGFQKKKRWYSHAIIHCRGKQLKKGSNKELVKKRKGENKMLRRYDFHDGRDIMLHGFVEWYDLFICLSLFYLFANMHIRLLFSLFIHSLSRHLTTTKNSTQTAPKIDTKTAPNCTKNSTQVVLVPWCPCTHYLMPKMPLTLIGF